MRTLTLLLSFCLAFDVIAAPGPAPTEAGPLPDAVVKAWTKAGAKTAWAGFLRGTGRPYISPSRDSLDKATSVPAFTFRDWRMGMATRLPAPATPFGLDLAGATITDANLKELAGLKGLVYLDLSSAKLTDAGLKQIVGMKKLTQLNLSHTKVTDAGLKHVAGLNGLKTLTLCNVPITDAGVKHLAGMKRLTALDLLDTKVSDAGLKHIANLKNLTWLALYNGRITDKGLKHLAGLKKLTYLDLGDTEVTREGLNTLQKALPKCKIKCPRFGMR
jgi:hypothetical protein